MSDVFHAFGRLPCELRLDIWELSMRPKGLGGVHSFTVYPGELPDTDDTPVVTSWFRDGPLHLAIPR